MSAMAVGDRYEDPLSAALRPPPDETPDERDARVLAARLAKERSRAIDERLAEDRKALERKKMSVKVLLLGARVVCSASGMIA